jgi:MscS family membrane protein
LISSTSSSLHFYQSGTTLFFPERLGINICTGAKAQSASDLDRNPLSPPDISTPQATLNTFLSETTAAIDAYRAGDPERMHARADRAFQTLATEYSANEADFQRAVDAALHLLAILIRIDLPPADQIPDAALAALPASWTIPNTELRMVLVQGKDDTPIGYRFSAETVARLPDFYQRVRELPVKAGFGEYDGVVERFRLGPGFATPGFIVSYVESLPPVWFATFVGEPWWKWAALAIAVLTALALFALAYRLAAVLDDGTRPTSGATALIRPLLVIVAILLTGFLRYVVADLVVLTGTQRTVALGTLSILSHLAVVWLIFMVAVRAAAAVIRIREMGVYALDAQLVRLVFKLAAVLLALYTLVNLAETLGVPVAPVVAGLGVGGLAVALAVRPTIENIFAGFVLFADAPVRVGEFCKFGDKMGTIEAIGLRSVRVRGLDRTVITVPNAEFCQLQLINFTRRDSILLHTRLQLRYETTPDQLRLVLTRLRELLIKHPKVSPDPARVRFVEYGASSLDLEIFAFVETRDFSEFLAIQEDLNLRIKDIVEASGSAFAFPSQTLYLERSHGLDAELTKAAETEVARWRSEHRLPFPDHDQRTRRELSNTLDYPPEGSPERLASDRS